MWASSPTKRRLFVFSSFYEPFSWIVFNILPYFVVILLIADYMVIIGTLEYSFAFVIWLQINLFGHLIFIPTNQITQRRGRVSRPWITIKPKQHMNVIRHNYKLSTDTVGYFSGISAIRFSAIIPQGFGTGDPSPTMADKILRLSWVQIVMKYAPFVL